MQKNTRPSRLSSGVVVVRNVGDERLFLLLGAFNHRGFAKEIVENGRTGLKRHWLKTPRD